MLAPPQRVSIGTTVARYLVSDPEDLLFLRLELLITEDAAVPQIGEPLQLAHVLGLGRGGRRRLDRFLAATEVLLRPKPALHERATPLHARHGPVGLPRLHPLCTSFRHKPHLLSPSSLLVRLA